MLIGSIWFAGCHVRAPVGFGEHVVDDEEELHDAFVEVQVFQPLEQVGVLASVRTQQHQLLGLGLRGEDLHDTLHRFDRDDLRAKQS